MRKLLSSVGLVAVLAAGSIVAPAISSAQTTTTSSTISAGIQAQLDLIQSLTQQIQALQQQIQNLQVQRASSTIQLISSLSLGSQGQQVSVLQALLAANPGIYPEGLITGFFGKATERAVKRFQQEHGIEQVGLVGPKTLKKLNELLDENPISFEVTSTASSTVSSTFPGFGQGQGEGDNHQGENDNEGEHGKPCAIIPPGHLIAPGWLRHNEDDNEHPIVPPCQILPPGIIGQLPTSTPTSTPSTTVTLAISGLTLQSLASTSAMVSWGTTVAANGAVFYATSTPPVAGATSTFSTGTSTLSTTHGFTLSGLSASTTYFYFVQSIDALNHTVTSSVQSFTTTSQ